MVCIAVFLFAIGALQELYALSLLMDIVSHYHETRMRHGLIFTQLGALALFCLCALAFEKSKEFKEKGREQATPPYSEPVTRPPQG